MIRHYSGEFESVCDIFYDAIHGVAARYYALEQLNAWAPLPKNYEAWRWRCELKRPFLFVRDGDIAGFIELDPDGHIDCHYVRSRYNRMGIGQALLDHVLHIAQHLQWRRLYVEASHVARGLYLKNGFTVDRENVVQRRGVDIQNALMSRRW